MSHLYHIKNARDFNTHLEISQLMRDLNAKAATIGESIVLSENASISDKELIGHEIAHVIQQRQGKVSSSGIDPDQNLETAAQLEGRNFAAGTKVRGKRAMLEPKKANSSETIQRKETAKTSDVTWTRDFTGKTGKDTVGLHLTRETDGNLKGSYQENQNPAIEVTGKILESADNDLFLEGADGSKWHGKYTATNTLLFGNIVLPKQTLKNLELKATPIITTPASQPENPAKTSDQTWTKNFTAQQGKDKLTLELTRGVDGSLNGSCQLNDQNFTIQGKLLQDDDVYLEATNGTTFHGRFTNPNTLLFGNIHVPALGKVVARDLKSVEFKVSQEITPVAKPGDAQRTEGPHQISQKGIEFIMNHEKFIPKIYIDATYNATIGYGHKVLPSEIDQFKGKMTLEEGLALLKKDIAALGEAPVNNLVTVPLDQQTFDVLVSFAFNAGADALK